MKVAVVAIALVLYQAAAVRAGDVADSDPNLCHAPICQPRHGPAVSRDSVAMTELPESVKDPCRHFPTCSLETQMNGGFRRPMTSVERNLDKWLQVEDYGTRVQGTCLLPMKALSTNDGHFHSMNNFLLRNPDVSLIIDLTSEVNDHEISDRFPHVRLLHLPLVSKVIPSRKRVRDFIQLVQDNLPLNNETVAVHCHYGFNRTGFLVCSYLCEVVGISPGEAIERFRNARPPGIRHEHFIKELYKRYSESNELESAIELESAHPPV